MSWIKMRTDLWDDPRVAALCDRLRIAEAPVVGGLYWLWTTADQHSVDGLLVSMTPAALDRKTGLKGFAEALEQVGWLMKEAGGLRLPRFDEHNGESAKQRALAAKRQTKARHADVTQPSRTQRDETVTGALPRLRQDEDCSSSVFRLPSSEALPEKIRSKIPTDWFAIIGEPLTFHDANGSEPTVFEPISRVETLSDPTAMRDWWRYQLGHPSPVLGREAVWCLVAFALGLKFGTSKSTKWKSRIGVWANAIQRGFWTQAAPYLNRAEKLLRPVIFTEGK